MGHTEILSINFFFYSKINKRTEDTQPTPTPTPTHPHTHTPTLTHRNVVALNLLNELDQRRERRGVHYVHGLRVGEVWRGVWGGGVRLYARYIMNTVCVRLKFWLSLSRSLARSLSLSLSLARSLALTQSRARSLSLSLSFPLSRSLALSLSLCGTHTHKRTNTRTTPHHTIPHTHHTHITESERMRERERERERGTVKSKTGESMLLLPCYRSLLTLLGLFYHI